MDIKLLESILSQISNYAEVIQLYWLGEPFLDEMIFEKIKMCKLMTKSKVILSTNGSIITEESAGQLRDSGLDEIIVSIDACESQEIYGKIRKGGDLQQLNNNIQVLLKYCNNINIVLQFIELYVNKSELAPFLEKWRGYHTHISPLYTWSNQIPALNLASDKINLLDPTQRKPCADLWKKMTIHWNGIVSACCFDFADSIHLGDCQKQKLIEIWNGQIVSDIRLKQEKGLFEGICKNCDAWAEPDEYITMYHL